MRKKTGSHILKYVQAKLGFVVPLILVAFIAGCINYEQDTQLNYDGSGTAEIHYWAQEDVVSFLSDGPLGFDEEKIELQYEGPGITVLSVSSVMDEVDSTRHVKVSLEFESIVELSKTKAFKDVEISWEESDGLMKFSQEMKTDDNGGSMGMEQYTFSYTYTMPGEIVSSNATDHTGQTLSWKYKLSELSSGVTLSATVKNASFGSELFVPAVIIIGGLFILIIIVVVIRKGSKAKTIEATATADEIDETADEPLAGNEAETEQQS